MLAAPALARRAIRWRLAAESVACGDDLTKRVL
jgi:hypothetical protein